MESAWRVVAIVFATVAIVGLILLARGPVDSRARPMHPIAVVEGSWR